MSNFNEAFEHVLGIEGGYVNDSRDPGGETKYGICKRQYPDLDIKGLTLESAKEIYRRDYWMPVKGDQLPHPLNLFVFDAAVNQGVETAIKLLQKTLNVTQDGILGQDTLKAVQKMPATTPSMYLADRALRYTDTKNFDIYGRGWFRRLFNLAMEV